MAERLDMAQAERTLEKLKDEKDLRGLERFQDELYGESRAAAEDWGTRSKQDVYKLGTLVVETGRAIAKLKAKESNTK